MKILLNNNDLNEALDNVSKLGFVPTMGCLHQGHISLIRRSKYECKKTINSRRIIHMLIDNYYVDNKSYSSFPENLNCNHVTIDIKFICLSEILIEKIEKILKKYQITINHILSSEYVESFLNNNEKDIFKMSAKIIEGFNENEVSIIPKIPNNKGFFEKFFNFFN